MRYTKSKQDLDTFFERLASRKLVIFGTGAGAIAAAHLINKSMPDKPIEYFCDNNPQKQGLKLFGANIVSPDVLCNVGSDDTIILVASTRLDYSDEIFAQLKQINPDFDVFSMLALALFRNNGRADDAKYLSDHADEAAEVMNMLHDDNSKWIYGEVVRRNQVGHYDFSDLITPGYQLYIPPEFFANVRLNNEIIIDGGGTMAILYGYITAL